MATIIDDEIWACDDCTMIVCNDDASGMDDATEKECRDAIEKIQTTNNAWLASNSGGEGNEDEGYQEFSHDRCDICDGLAGSRHRFALIKHGIPMKCDQCQMLTINGINTHETGCPNAKKKWDSEEGVWYRLFECSECGECGDEVREGYTCNCGDLDWEPDEDEDEDDE